MERIGIRELKAHASALVSAVQERRARYIITRHGEPVAVLMPVDAVPSPPDPEEVWERLETIREELGKGRQSEKSAVEILSEMRR